MVYFCTRLFSLTEPPQHPSLLKEKDPARLKAYISEYPARLNAYISEYPARLKAYISENLRQKFDASRVADTERANTVAQFNRLCDVLEKM
jgi:hypothetical protein